MQRDKRLKEREQFELEHEDAQMGYSADQLNDEDFIIQMEILRKNRQKAKMGAMAFKKQTTFGLTERFAPVPGSTQSKS